MRDVMSSIVRDRSEIDGARRGDLFGAGADDGDAGGGRAGTDADAVPSGDPRATSAEWDDAAELEEDYDEGALDVARRVLEVHKAKVPRDGAPAAGDGEAHRLKVGYFRRKGRFPQAAAGWRRRRVRRRLGGNSARARAGRHRISTPARRPAGAMTKR